MAGLLIKELIARGDLEMSIVVAPGGLVEQWQDELEKSLNQSLKFFLMIVFKTRVLVILLMIKKSLIARLDVLARNEEVREKLLNSLNGILYFR